MLRTLTNQRGMTLAEILVAVAIIGIGLVALAAAIPLATYGIQEGNQLSTATFLANQRLEQVRNAAWTATPAVDNLGVSASTTVPPQSGGTTTFPDESPMTAPYGGYSRTVRVQDCSVGGGCSGIVNATMRQVTVTVSYTPLTGVGQAATGTTKSAVVTMFITQR
jgi:prepilin-type N-terminal cleavage/methylation domain-containing protein